MLEVLGFVAWMMRRRKKIDLLAYSFGLSYKQKFRSEHIASSLEVHNPTDAVVSQRNSLQLVTGASISKAFELES